MTTEDDAKVPDGFIPMPGFNDEVDAEIVGDEPAEVKSEQEAAEEQAEEAQPAEASDDHHEQQPDNETDEQIAKDQQAETHDQPLMFDIVHNGVAMRVTQEKMTELAQKGYDYDKKIGHHQRLAQLVEADPALQDVINGYLTDKVDTVKNKPELEVKPLSDYDDETAWLKDNLEALQEKIVPAPAAPTAPAEMSIEQMLMVHDPQGYKTVAPQVLQAAQNELTVKQYQEINSDPAEFFKFYDKVSARMQATEQGGPAVNAGQTPLPKQKFTAKPGNASTAPGSKKLNAFEMSSSDFKKTMDAITMGRFN